MSFVYLSKTAHKSLIEWLSEKGHTPILYGGNNIVYSALSGHTDLALCKLGNSPVSPLFYGSPQGENYPQCAVLCAAANSNYFIHNTKITHPLLLEKAKRIGLNILHTNQGFTRCNLLPVGGGFITSDMGIYKVLSGEGIPSLLIEEGHIVLPGHQYGFIGGCAGQVGNHILFNGDLSVHPSFENIALFICEMGYSISHFPGLPLTDIGSIIESDTYIEL